YKFYGRYKNKRVSRWINKEYIENHPNLNSYKVLLPKSNGSGAMGERLSDTIISKPGEGHTQTYISIGSFETSYETQSVSRYIKTKFLRLLLGTLKVTQDNKKASWSNVPLLDFCEKSEIDWTKPIHEIDQQL